jgi:hypothetical protein
MQFTTGKNGLLKRSNSNILKKKKNAKIKLEKRLKKRKQNLIENPEKAERLRKKRVSAYLEKTSNLVKEVK